jgi:hypothetical protein
MNGQPPRADELVVRWTIGDVRARGFELLRLSILCAIRLFGARTQYRVCVNSLSAEEAQERTGELPTCVQWREVMRTELPELLRTHFDGSLSEGTGWKLMPLRLDPEGYELALDNDCILWRLPEGMGRWLQSDHGSLLAEDVDRCLGCFDAVCPPGALNSGIRGFSPGADVRGAFAEALHAAAEASGETPRLVSELDEQGLQAAAVARMQPLFFVANTEVSICSPFWPRSPELGTCGAHFVGMNVRHIPWNYYDRPADEWLEEHWQRHRPALYEKAGLEMPAGSGRCL